MGTSRTRLRLLLAFAALSLIGPASAEETRDDNPPSGPAIRWTPIAPLSMENGWTFVRTRAGDEYRFEGESELGLGYGEVAPTSVRWITSKNHRVSIPLNDDASFLVFRSSFPGRIEQAVDRSTPMDWYRLDERTEKLIRAGGALPAEDAELPGDARTILRELQDWKTLLEPSDTRALLLERWRTESLRVRPLSQPFFRTTNVASEHAAPLATGIPVDNAPFGASEWATLRAGTTQRFSGDFEVLEVRISATSTHDTVATLLEGDAPVQTFRHRMSGGYQWSYPETVRLVLPNRGKAQVSIRLDIGEIAYSVRGLKRKYGVLEGIGRDPTGSTLRERDTWRDPKEDLAGSIRSIANAFRTKDARVVQQLAKVTDPFSNESPAAFAPGAPRTLYGERFSAAILGSDPNQQLLGRPLPKVFTGLGFSMLRHATRLHAIPAYAFFRPAARAKVPFDAPFDLMSDGASDATAKLDALSRLSAWISQHHEEGSLRGIVKEAWHATTRWRTVPLENGLAESYVERAVDDGRSDHLCLQGEAGLLSRWTLIDDKKKSVKVDAPPGTYARFVARPKSGSTHGSFLRVDDAQLAVHGELGLASFGAVRGGEHSMMAVPAQSGSAPEGFVVNVPRKGLVPCEELRDLEATFHMGGQASFAFDGFERETLGMIEFGEISKEQEFRVSAGAQEFKGIVLPGNGSRVTFPVPAGVKTFSIDVTPRAPFRLRVREPIRTYSNKEEGFSTAKSVRPESVEFGEELLGLRKASREIRQGSALAKEVGRIKRARILSRLGYQSLASLDREEDPPKQEGVTFMVYPRDTPPLVPIGLLGKVAPFEATVPSEIEDAFRQGQLTSLLRRSEGAKEDSTRYFRGLAFERQGEAQAAALTFSTLGRDTGSGPLLAHAANLYADASGLSSSKEFAMRALITSIRATEFGGDPGLARSRVLPNVSWDRPALYEDSNGFALVRTTDERAPTPKDRVEGAWLDAPEGAILLRTGKTLRIRVTDWPGGPYPLSTQCYRLFPGDPPCEISVLVDGAPFRSKADTILLPPGPHLLTLLPPKEFESLSYVTLATTSAPSARDRAKDEEGEVPRTWQDSHWHELEPGRPFTFEFMGPTVLHLEARAAEENAEYSLHVTSPRQGNKILAAVPLSGISDRQARRFQKRDPKGAPIGALVDRMVPVDENGPQLYTFQASRRTLFRIAAATVRAPVLPKVELSIVRPSAIQTIEPTEQPLVREQTPGIGVTLGASVSYVNPSVDLFSEGDITSLSDRSLRPYLEPDLSFTRELALRRVWIGARAFARFREGPESVGAHLTLDVAPRGAVPGLFLGLLGVTQTTDALAFGGRATFDAFWMAQISPLWQFSPLVFATGNLVDERVRSLDGADPDVFSSYANSHPLYGGAAARLLFRPWIDTLLRFETRIRLLPESAPLDRIDARLSLDTAPGKPWIPWFGLAWLTSVRPAAATRPSTFARHTPMASLSVWAWIAGQHRLTFSASARGLFDAPQGDFTRPGFSFALGLAYDLTTNRGLRDFPARLVPFRDRQEEGSLREKELDSKASVWEEP